MKSVRLMLLLTVCFVQIFAVCPAFAAESTIAEPGTVTAAEEESAPSAGIDISLFGDSISMPQVKSIIYEDEFDGGLNTRIEKTKGSGSLGISGGCLITERLESAFVNVPDETRIYLNSDKSPSYANQTAIEFTLSRDALKLLDFGIFDSNDTRLSGVKFLNDGFAAYSFRQTEESAPQYAVLGESFSANTDVKLTVDINHVAGTLSVWANDNVVMYQALCENKSDNIAYVSFLMRISSYQTVSLKNFKAYESEMTGANIVNMDYSLLTFDKLSTEAIGEITADLNLPDKGENGSTIVWSSDDENVITATGKVVRSENEDKTVTLTAVISSGTESKTKTFDITVKKLTVTDKPSVKTLIAEDTMMNTKFSTLYSPELGSPKATEEGIRIAAGDAFDYYHDTVRTNYYVPLVYEFKLKGSGTCVTLYDSAGAACFSIRVDSDGIHALMRGDYSAEAAWEKIKSGYVDGTKYTILADPASGMFSLWYGEDKFVEAKYGAEPVSRLYRFNVVQTGELSYIYDFKAYVANVPSADSVLFDSAYVKLNNLTWQDADKITDNMYLPIKGNAGSSISWVSSNEAVISADGKVNIPAEDTPVTLTATIVNGNYEQVREISLIAKAGGKDEKPEIKKDIFTDRLDENLPGSQWALGSTNGRVVAKEEKLEFKRLTYSEEQPGVTEAYFYFDQSRGYLSGVYCMEFTLRRFGTPYTLYMRANGKGGDYFAANWLASGDLRVYTGSSSTLLTGVGESAKLTVLFNTTDSTYSLWVNDELRLYNQPSRESNSNIRHIRFYAEKENKNHVEIDNFRFYEAYSLSTDRVPLDYNHLVETMLTNPEDAALPFGYVSENLTLPVYGEYGSDISWSSDNEAVISNEGVVSKADDYKTVTLTATISSGATSMEKQFMFVVMPNISDSAAAASRDLDLLTYEVLACHEAGSREIKRALNFVGAGAFGSTISWQTTNTEYITISGRVIRPRVGEENAAVTVTATAENGGIKQSKEFHFTVIADEEFTDPEAMTDEEFFGVWNGNEWSVEPKWNYEYSGLEKLGETVKQIGESGDYTAAKEELLSYFQNERKSYSTISKSDRNTGWANMVSDDFYHLQQSKYYQGSGYVGKEWNSYYLDITRLAELTPGSNVAYSVRAWYNESSMAEIARHNAADSKMRPKLELTINGVQRIIEAEDSVEVRAGIYKDTNYGDEETMKVQTFGDFYGDDTRYAKIKFNLSGLAETDVVTSARLLLYARTTPTAAEEKRLIAIFEPSSTWESSEVTWNSFTGYVYSFNGLPGKYNWKKIDDADTEFFWQVARFYALPAIALEYQLSGDSSYVYKAQRILEDFLTDTSNYRSSGRNYDEDPNGIRGGFPRSLDVSQRMGRWQQALDIMMKNPYATPEFATAFLKSMWDSYNFLAHYRTASGNWLQYELQALLDGAMKMPEFKDSTAGVNWYNIANGELGDLIFLNNLEDGSYVEACSDYSITAFENFVAYKRNVIEAGGSVSEEYDELLKKMAYYQAMLYTSDGTGISYGDGGDAKRPTGAFEKVIEWFGDKELEYIITYGKSGTKPDWTSINFPLSTVTAMHADWSKTAPYLFTNVRGGGQHGHADYNGIVLSAYNRVLLADAGKFTYDSTDPYRIYAQSTKAHNTVLINDSNQRKITGVIGFTHENGEVHEFTTNSAFDFLSQSSTSYSGFDHRRSITFLKPNVWIVSDRIDPTNTTKTNNYKQLWHMLPTAGLASSEDNRTIYSNFESGANIILAAADSDVQVKEALGWVDDGYQVAQPSTYGYFEKSNVKGTATIDTVIAVNNDDETAALTSEKLETTGDATAVRINLTSNGEDFTGYYRMSYDGSEGGFGDYITDAQLAYVQEKADGTISSVLLKNGTYIKKNDGTVIFESEEKTAEVYVDMSGTNLYITTDAGADVSEFTINCEGEPLKLYVNAQEEPFTFKAGYISGIGSESPESSAPEKVPSAGITDDKKEEADKDEEESKDNDDDKNDGSGGSGGSGSSGSSGGSGGSGGSSGGGGASGGLGGGSASIGGGSASIGGGSGGAIVVFPDTVGHWARDFILDLKSKNIVNGDENGNFNPDSKITRAEFVAIVTRALGLGNPEYQNTFSDVDASSWYAKSVQAGLDGGLISEDSVFRPNDPISRQEMAKIIAEAAELSQKYELSESYIEKYTDKDSISDWAKGYVGLVTASGLMSGRADGGFYPLDNATRAEAATVISRMIKD